MSHLKIFGEKYVNVLRASIPNNLKLYTNDKIWANKGTDSRIREIETSLVINEQNVLLEPESGDLKDLENAIRMYTAFPDLTPLQARDPRLWVHLTHVEYWNYMVKRWPVSEHMQDLKKAPNYINERYFIPRSHSRSLLRNGIARLWWIAKLSYEPERDNPFELTQVLLSTLDITQSLLERNLGRAPCVLKGFLEFLLQNKDMLLCGGNVNRYRIRKLAKFLNMQGGICILDCLGKSEIKQLLDDELEMINKNQEAVVEA